MMSHSETEQLTERILKLEQQLRAQATRLQAVEAALSAAYERIGELVQINLRSARGRR